MKEFILDMLKRAKPWGIGCIAMGLCWLISLLLNGENGMTSLWMSITLILGVILIAHLLVIIIPCISTFIGRITGKLARKGLQIDKTDFENNKDYYRDILKNNTPLILGYLDNLEFGKRDLIAEILYFQKKDIIKIEDGRLKKNNNLIHLNLKDSEMEILDKIIVGKLVIRKEFLSELRDVISREAESLELLRKKIIKRKTHKKKSNIIVENVLGIFFVIILLVGIIGAFIPEVLRIWAGIMALIGILPFLLLFIGFPIAMEYRQNLGVLYKRTPKGRELNQKLEGLKNYLKDYSLMDERESKEIELWDDYLIYSVMFGQNKKIIEEYEKYIEIIE